MKRGIWHNLCLHPRGESASHILLPFWCCTFVMCSQLMERSTSRWPSTHLLQRQCMVLLTSLSLHSTGWTKHNCTRCGMDIFILFIYIYLFLNVFGFCFWKQCCGVLLSEILTRLKNRLSNFIIFLYMCTLLVHLYFGKKVWFFLMFLFWEFECGLNWHPITTPPRPILQHPSSWKQ